MDNGVIGKLRFGRFASSPRSRVRSDDIPCLSMLRRLQLLDHGIWRESAVPVLCRKMAEIVQWLAATDEPFYMHVPKKDFIVMTFHNLLPLACIHILYCTIIPYFLKKVNAGALFCLTFLAWHDIIVIHNKKYPNGFDLFVFLAKNSSPVYSERSYTWIIRKNFM